MQYILTFAVMLTVGLVIGNLTAGVRYQARIARYREQRTRHLYEMSKSLAVGRTQRDIVQTSEQFIRSTFHASNLILLPDEQGRLRPLTSPTGMTPWDEAIARWSFDKGLPAGAGTDTLPGVPYQILPLRSADKNHGLVIVEPSNLRQLMIPEQQRLLETFTLLVASALERLALTASEEQARLASERESIRNSLLAALSHDLRTPLTVLFGQSEILTLDLAAEGSKHAMQASEIRQHVLNTTRLVNNLLDMARIQSGGFNLKKEWLTLEEVVGSALKMLEPGLGGRHIELDMPEPLTLIHVDGPLFERVLINLLETRLNTPGQRPGWGLLPGWINVCCGSTSGITGRVFRPVRSAPYSKNLRAVIRNPPFRALGWVWRSARRLSTCMVAPFPQRTARKVGHAFVLHFLLKPHQNLMNYQRICD